MTRIGRDISSRISGHNAGGVDGCTLRRCGPALVFVEDTQHVAELVGNEFRSVQKVPVELVAASGAWTHNDLVMKPRPLESDITMDRQLLILGSSIGRVPPVAGLTTRWLLGRQ